MVQHIFIERLYHIKLPIRKEPDIPCLRKWHKASDTQKNTSTGSQNFRVPEGMWPPTNHDASRIPGSCGVPFLPRPSLGFAMWLAVANGTSSTVMQNGGLISVCTLVPALLVSVILDSPSQNQASVESIQATWEGHTEKNGSRDWWLPPNAHSTAMTVGQSWGRAVFAGGTSSPRWTARADVTWNRNDVAPSPGPSQIAES